MTLMGTGPLGDDDAALPGLITKPHPRDGSFSANGSETGESEDVDATVVVVLEVGPDEPVVVDEVELEDVAALVFEYCSPDPVSRSASSTTQSPNRSGQWRWGWELGKIGISWSP
jgi:hypothetical protein